MWVRCIMYVENKMCQSIRNIYISFYFIDLTCKLYFPLFKQCINNEHFANKEENVAFVVR